MHVGLLLISWMLFKKRHEQKESTFYKLMWKNKKKKFWKWKYNLLINQQIILENYYKCNGAHICEIKSNK